MITDDPLCAATVKNQDLIRAEWPDGSGFNIYKVVISTRGITSPPDGIVQMTVQLQSRYKRTKRGNYEKVHP